MPTSSKRRGNSLWWCLPVIVAAWVAWCLQPNTDPQGGASVYCDNFEGKPVRNRVGWTVTWHTTACTTLGSDVATYIHVHPVHSDENRHTLVLRYFDTSDTDFPEIEWTSDTDLHIKVGNVSQITKLVDRVADIHIKYDIGKENFPRLNSGWK